MPKVFVSYRREDNAYAAQQIYGELKSHFGSGSVVFDVDTIPIGVDFRRHLIDQVSGCDILLAIIGDRWLETLNERLHDPKDFVRIEIQAALRRNIPIIPVLVGKASMPSEELLPANLAGLAYQNAAEVRAGADLANHMKRLVGGVEHLLTEKRRESGETTRKQQGTERTPTDSSSSFMSSAWKAAEYSIPVAAACILATALIGITSGLGKTGEQIATWGLVVVELGLGICAIQLFRYGKRIALYIAVVGIVWFGTILLIAFIVQSNQR